MTHESRLSRSGVGESGKGGGGRRGSGEHGSEGTASCTVRDRKRVEPVPVKTLRGIGAARMETAAEMA